MSKAHAVLRLVRKIHLYFGIFTTPALLFFAVTGAMQTFSLHETTPGSSYKPPAWIATLAQLHKKQNTTVPVHRVRPTVPDNAHANGIPAETEHSKTEPGNGANRNSEPPGQPKSHLPMKFFFLLVSVSLLLSVLTGVYMSYRYDRGWWRLTGLLLAGVVVPLLLLPF
jgi:hypothetical protein